MAIAKVVLNDNTLIDLTQDTVNTEKLQENIVAYGADGLSVTGTMDLDSTVENQIISKTLTNFSDTTISTLADFAFIEQPTLSRIELGELTSIPLYCFAGDALLTNITNVSKVTSIGNYSFQNCSSLSNISFPSATSVGQYAFYSCTALSSISLPSVTSVGQYAFYNCTALSSISLPKTTSIGNYGFCECNNLISLNVPLVNSVGTSCFYNASALSNNNFSTVSTIGAGAFQKSSLRDSPINPVSIGDSGIRDTLYFNTGYFPRLTTISGTYSFAGSYHTTRYSTVASVAMPVLTSLGTSNALTYNDATVSIDIGAVTTIPAQSFRECANFKTLVLRTSTLVSLANINVFTNTCFASGKTGGTLYVPEELISSYEEATNWATILSYTNNQIKSIESTATDSDAPIDLTTYYIDGTLIPTN